MFVLSTAFRRTADVDTFSTDSFPSVSSVMYSVYWWRWYNDGGWVCEVCDGTGCVRCVMGLVVRCVMGLGVRCVMGLGVGVLVCDGTAL